MFFIAIAKIKLSANAYSANYYELRYPLNSFVLN